MKQIGIGIMALLLAGTFAPTAFGAKISLSTGVTMDYVRDDSAQDTKGVEYTMPFSIAYTSKRASLSFNSSYAGVTVDTQTTDEAKLSGVTDSMCSATYKLPVSFGIVVFGADINLPTGKAELNSTQRNAEIGGDYNLLTVDDFGEGWNLGGSVGVMYPFGKTLLTGVTVGYVNKRAFDPTTDTSDDEKNPGNQTLLTLLANWMPSQQWTVNSMVVYTHTGADTIDGDDSFRTGDSVKLSGGANFAYSKQLGIAWSVSKEFQGKNRELAGGDLETEPKNSNSGKFSVGMTVKYALSDALQLQGQTELRYAPASERRSDMLDQLYKGRSIRYKLGGGASYALNKTLTLSGGLAWIHVKQDRDQSFEEDVATNGAQVNLGLAWAWGQL